MVRASVTGLAALLSLLSVFVVPWAWYGDMDVPLHRLPNWGVYVGGVVVLYVALVLPLAVAVCAGVVAVVTTVLVASGYDDAVALFPDVVPMVAPSLGPGPFLAVLAVLAGLLTKIVVSKQAALVDVGHDRS